MTIIPQNPPSNHMSIDVNDTGFQPIDLNLLAQYGPNTYLILENKKNKIVLYAPQNTLFEKLLSIIEAIELQNGGRINLNDYPVQKVESDADLVLDLIDHGDVRWPDEMPVTLDSLFENGKPVRGAQSRIAEALNIPNAGQANRKRIDNVLSILSTILPNKNQSNKAKAA